MKKSLIIVLAALTYASCANRGVGPQGGPKDTIPPKPRSCEPEMGTLNFQGNRIEVSFDEYIQLDNVGSNLIMSPPQQNPPDVKARGKKLIVQFQDSLYPNTTYTLDFGAAVCDYREKVPLRGYSFYFSTGDQIDTLETAGHVYDAQTLNPMKGITVGVYSNMADSAFEREPFLRIAKTDSAGGFRIKNIHQGTYRIYAVNDMSKDYRLTIGEALAFTDQTVTVQSSVVSLPDSTNSVSDSVLSVSDTVMSVYDTVLSVSQPKTNTALFLFKEVQQKLFLQRSTRDEQHRITLSFSATPDSLPHIRPLCDTLNYHVQYSAKRDTAFVWLTDSMSIRQDSLFWEVQYRQTDSVFNLVWVTDTLRTIWRAPKLTAKAKETQDRMNRNRRLTLTSNARKGFEVYDTLRISCSTPLDSIAVESMHLFELQDTVRKPVSFSIAPYDTLPMTLYILAAVKPGMNYELQLDSGALHDIYGVTHINATYGLLVKALTDYSTLRVRLKSFEPKARIQLLNSKDQVIRELPAAEDGAFFEYLKPDAYYVRLYIDENEDGKWTTGSWEHKRQPEIIYYFPEKIQTKSNWDFEEEWDHLSIEPVKSKPKELIKVMDANAKK